VASGATPRQRLLEFDRTIASLEGTRDEHRNLVLASREEIARAEAEIETLRQQRLAEIAAQLPRPAAAWKAWRAASAPPATCWSATTCARPQAGVVVNIRTVTPGAVVASGAPLMEIVPDGDRLIALAQLPPEAIDTVHVGRTALVRLIAYRRATAPVVDGEVIYVSADLLEDERDGTSYFEARSRSTPRASPSTPRSRSPPGCPSRSPSRSASAARATTSWSRCCATSAAPSGRNERAGPSGTRSIPSVSPCI
jgi:HlyD family secretion protein